MVAVAPSLIRVWQPAWQLKVQSRVNSGLSTLDSDWGCVHRHLIVTILAQLFCARVRHRLCPEEIVTDAQRLTLEQVRRAAVVFVRCVDLPPRIREREYKAELEQIRDHQTRNAQASLCHRKKRMATYHAMGINPEKIKCVDRQNDAVELRTLLSRIERRQ